MKKIFYVFAFILAFFASSLFTSCSNIMGYSVVLWNIGEEDIQDGTVVSVYLKSNISHVYVIGVPDSKEKIEVPLWKCTTPERKGKAKKRALMYKNYQNKYARCVLDGLPIRSDKVNTSKQVYRLRNDEVVKVLYKGEGAIPTNGKTNLEGEWLRVLTSDGTQGWCFSHNLRLFSMTSEVNTVAAVAENTEEQTDTVLENMLSKKWYPDYFSSMISSSKYNLDTFVSGYGFDTGKDSGTVSIHLSDLNVEYVFSEITKTENNVYKYKDIPLQVTVRGKNSLIVQYTDERGMPKSYNFVTLKDDTDIDSIIENEKNRRTDLYESIRRLGPEYKSSNYGTLTFNADNEFEWKGYKLLVPNVISSAAKGKGDALIKYYLPKDLSSKWDGVLTFKFENMDKEVNFVYKRESNGLRLGITNVSKVKESYSVTLPSNSLVLFFQN